MSAQAAIFQTDITEKARPSLGGQAFAENTRLRKIKEQLSQISPQEMKRLGAKTDTKPKKRDDSKRTINKVAAEAKLSPKAVRQAVEMVKNNSDVAGMIHAGGVTFTEGKKLAEQARAIAVEAESAPIESPKTTKAPRAQ